MDFTKQTNKDLLQSFNLLRLVNKDVILSGSLALILRGTIEERVCDDIDIIVPYYIDFSSLGMLNFSDSNYIDKTCSLIIESTGIKVDIIIDNTRRFDIIEGIKVSHKEPILIAKLEAFLYFETIKHKQDLLTALK